MPESCGFGCDLTTLNRKLPRGRGTCPITSRTKKTFKLKPLVRVAATLLRQMRLFQPIIDEGQGLAYPECASAKRRF
jgi:hypothetical protein